LYLVLVSKNYITKVTSRPDKGDLEGCAKRLKSAKRHFFGQNELFCVIVPLTNW
jgi:hypothetical protein